MSKRLLPLFAAALVVLASCAGTKDRVSPEWTEAMFFKNAQEAMDENRYKTALYYYEVYLVRYPENHQRAIAAEYELAFIRYKTGDFKAARAGFEAILDKYETSPYAMLYHPRFKQLSEIGLERIEKARMVNNRLMWRRQEKKWAEEHGLSIIDDGSSD